MIVSVPPRVRVNCDGLTGRPDMVLTRAYVDFVSARRMTRRRWRAIGAAGSAATLLVTSLVATPLRAIAATAEPPAPQPMVSVHGSPAHTRHIPIHNDAATAWKPPAVSWPAAGSATVDLGVTAAPPASRTRLPSAVAPDSAGPASMRAGTLPVSVGRVAGRAAPTQIRVDLAGHAGAQAAGVNGMLLSATGGAGGSGAVRLTVDTSSFAGAFGGDFAHRLRLVELPACA